MRLALIAIFLALGCNPESDADKGAITIFAAASLTDALNELVTRFELQHPDIAVSTHVGATSLLARQIQQGAPADLFMAASTDWMHYLQHRDLTVGPETAFAENTLVILGASFAPSLTSFSELLSVRRLAVADPAHVPAGIYAKQALQCAGIWDELQSVVIPTLDVRAALTSVSSGAADYAIVYGSDSSILPELELMLRVPESCAPKISYRISALRRSENLDAAAAFIAFTVDSLQRDLWTQFGFNS